MMRFEEPEIKVVRFNTPDVLTLSMNDSFEGGSTDHFASDSQWNANQVAMFIDDNFVL